MRPEKQLLLEEVKQQIDKHGSFVIMRYSSLNANKANKFRRDVAKMGGGMEVIRKRILVKAADAAGIKLDLDALDGHIALVFGGNDALETTKFVFKYGEDNDKAVEVIGGQVDGRLYNAADIKKLSQLPSLNDMRAQFLGTLAAPMAETLGVMDALVSSVVYCLANKAEQK